MNDRAVRLALPSKGRLEAETLSFLEECNLRVKKPNPRQYQAHIPNVPGLEVVFQRPRDIPHSISSGNIDLGITGYDVVQDVSDVESSDIVIIHEALGYGECALTLAVPIEWQSVNDLEGLRQLSAKRPNLRVATRHENITRRFLEANALNDIHLVSADGALEAAPAIGYADFIADITSSGTTLRENNLKPLMDGVVIESEAVFIGNAQALSSRQIVRDQTLFLLELIEAHLNAQNQYMVAVNIRGRSADEIAEQFYTQTDLMGLQGPTVAPLMTRTEDADWWSLSFIVHANDLYRAVQQLRAIGGSGVVATPAVYIFEEQPERALQIMKLAQQEALA